MAKPFKGIVNLDVTESVPDWGPYTYRSRAAVDVNGEPFVDFANEARMAFARD
jgi:hypothetical protein